jgi:hypothetical protein
MNGSINMFSMMNYLAVICTATCAAPKQEIRRRRRDRYQG